MIKYTQTYISKDNNTYILNISLSTYDGNAQLLELLSDNVIVRGISENTYFPKKIDQDLTFNTLYNDDLYQDINNESLTIQLLRDGVIVFDGIVDNKDSGVQELGISTTLRIRGYSFFKVVAGKSFTYQHGGFNPRKLSDIFITCIRKYINESELTDCEFYIDNRTFYNPDLYGTNDKTIFIKDFKVDIARWSSEGEVKDCSTVIQDICNDLMLTAIWWGNKFYIIHIDDLNRYNIADSLQKYTVNESDFTDDGTTQIDNSIDSENVDILSNYTSTLQSVDSIVINSNLEERDNFIQGGSIKTLDLEGNFIKDWSFSQIGGGVAVGHIPYYQYGDGSVILWYRTLQTGDFEIAIASSLNNSTGARDNTKYLKLEYSASGVFVGDQNLTPQDINFNFRAALFFIIKKDDGDRGDSYTWNISINKWVLYNGGVPVAGGGSSASVNRTNDDYREFSFDFVADYPQLDNLYDSSSDESPTPPNDVSNFTGEGYFAVYDRSTRTEFPVGATFGIDKESYPLNYTLKIIPDSSFDFRDNLRDNKFFQVNQDGNFSVVQPISESSTKYTRTLNNGVNTYTKDINASGGYDVKLPNETDFSVPEMQFKSVYMYEDIEGVSGVTKNFPFEAKLYYTLGLFVPRKIEDFNIIKIQKAFQTDLKRYDMEIEGDVNITPINILNYTFFSNIEFNTHANRYRFQAYQIKTTY